MEEKPKNKNPFVELAQAALQRKQQLQQFNNHKNMPAGGVKNAKPPTRRSGRGR